MQGNEQTWMSRLKVPISFCLSLAYLSANFYLFVLSFFKVIVLNNSNKIGLGLSSKNT